MSQPTGAPARRLQLGLYLPTWDDAAGEMVPWRAQRDLALLAEDAGWDTIWVADHFAPRLSGERIQRFWECWTLLAALAEATTRITLGPLITPTAFRTPPLLARMAMTVDAISGGRLLLGLGAGADRERGFEFVGLPAAERAGAFAEALAVIAPLVREGQVDHAGRYYAVRDYQLGLPQARPGGPPIWIAGQKPRMIALAARWGDAFNLNRAVSSPERLAEPFAALEAACRAIGRDPATIRRTGYAFVALRDETAADTAIADTAIADTAIAGTPDEIAARLHALHRAGMEHLTLVVDDAVRREGTAWPLTTPRHVAGFAPVMAALRRLEDSDAADHADRVSATRGTPA
jgi:alkanesulfonate monooxygenase SsuD/methylene tetrahydromethanopterin reductase-like flavin-dependent oxidoreductase (luciferase family)